MKEWLRITWAITIKDLQEGLRNKYAIGVLLSTLFLMVAYRFLPVLLDDSEGLNVLAYDAGNSTLATTLENSTALNLYTYSSQEKMIHYLANGDVPELGLVIPADFDRTLAGGGAPELTGYVMNWVSDTEARDMQLAAEGEIAALTGISIPIRMDAQRVYATPDAHGKGLLAAVGMVFILLMIGMMAPTHLMLEEKQNKTLDALLVSPASVWQVVLGKTLTGLTYAFLAMLVAWALNYALIVHWWLALLATLCGALFSTALGLVLGNTMRTRQQLSLWAWVIIVPLFMPMLLSFLENLLPAWLIAFFRLIPTVALFNVFRASFAGTVAPADWAPQLALVLGCTAVVLGGVAWILRRADR